MSKSKKKKKFPTKEELNFEESMKAKNLNQEDITMANETSQTSAAEAKAEAAPASAEAQQQPQTAAQTPAQAQQAAPAAPAEPQPSQAPAKPEQSQTAATAAQPQPATQAAPAAAPVNPMPTHWSDNASDPQTVAAMATAQTFISAHPDQAESVGLLILNSTSAGEFINLISQKGNSAMNTTATAPVAPVTANNNAAGMVPAVPVALPTAERSSFTGWTTTEMVCVGIGAAALVGVTVWAIVATIKANRYKAALADAVANQGM